MKIYGLSFCINHLSIVTGDVSKSWARRGDLCVLATCYQSQGKNAQINEKRLRSYVLSSILDKDVYFTLFVSKTQAKAGKYESQLCNSVFCRGETANGAFDADRRFSGPFAPSSADERYNRDAWTPRQRHAQLQIKHQRLCFVPTGGIRAGN